MTTSTTNSVPALDKAFQILDYITASNIALTSADIAKQLYFARSTTHNILQSLLQKGLVYKDADNRFYLGSYLMYWAGKFEQQQDVIRLFHELINQHEILLAQTITLSTIDWDKGEVVFLACHDSPSPLGFTFRAGVRVPATFSATGKAMLSTMSMDSIRQMYHDGLPTPLTRFGVDNYEKLAKELKQVNETRISLDDGQLREGMYCIGTYIRDAAGKTVAGLAASFLQAEYEVKRDEVSQALIVLANQIENRLGFKSDLIERNAS